MNNVSTKIPFQAIRTSLCALGLLFGVALHATTTIIPTLTYIQVPMPVLTFTTQTNYTYVLQYSTNGGVTWRTTQTLSGTGTDFAADGPEGILLDNVTWRVQETELTSTAPGDTVLIPAGSFKMGNPGAKATTGPEHTVTVDGFFMDTKLVSYGVWTNVYRWALDHGYQFAHAGSGKAPNHPVQTVDWYDAVKWCNARSEMERLTPCYYTANPNVGAVYRTGTVVLTANYVNWAANGYRLPTEAEWEKAARGGLVGKRFPRGDTLSHAQANYYANTLAYPYDLGPTGYHPSFTGGGFPYTSPVTSFQTNGFGLYDMAGNVSEWCWDWYSSTYYATSADSTNPLGPNQATYRTARGGSWLNLIPSAACYGRDARRPIGAYNSLGFRCVRTQE
jgi:formylglycine-generating enzyme